MIAWALYTVVISAALGLAAWALERALGLYGRPTRWVWLAAMAGSIAVPLALLVLPRATPTGAAGVAPPMAIESPIGPIVDRMPAASASGWPDLGPWLLAGWGLASLLLLVFFTRSVWRLRRARQSWRPTEIAGEPVLESDSLGPAVVGVVRTRIAVPAWIRALDEDLQRLIIAHERAHQAASDPLLLWLGVGACVAVPWCAPLWWQLRRLRLAIEVDCDRRVLAGGAPLSRYGSLLIEVGRRAGERPFALVGLFEPRSLLERRIRVMTTDPPGRRLPRAGGALAAVLLLGVAAASTPVPPAPELAFGQAADEPTADRSITDDETVPADTTEFRFTPYHEKPRCLSGCSSQVILQLFEQIVPRGSSCEVTVGLRIDTTGKVTATDRLKLEGPEACYAAAVDWAERTVWTPAELDGRKVVAWIAQPLNYHSTEKPEAGSGSTAEEGRSTVPVDTPPDGPDAPPRFERSVFEDHPRCVEGCSSEAIRAFLREAVESPDRCNAVIGMLIEPDGRVRSTDMLRSGPVPGCDEALQRWARSTRWTPARNGDGEVVSAWIAQPIRLYPEPGSEPDRTEESLHLEAETDPDAIAKTTLRRAMVAQEMYRAENDEYADAFELDLSPPRTVTLEVRRDGEGYVMVARHDHGTAAFCASSVTRAIGEGTDC